MIYMRIWIPKLPTISDLIVAIADAIAFENELVAESK